MRIKKATRKYEVWLAKHTKIVHADLALKHTRMAEDPFPLLRATFYRWVQVWPEVCSELARAPRVLAVGDLHVENFGTWRDQEGRLIWGVNDFDEACPMAYTNDLVRLAASAHLAIAANHLALPDVDACGAILKGYREGLEAGGRPFVLEEDHRWLREAATGELRDPIHFWGKMNALPSVRGDVPKSARKALEDLMPAPGLVYRVAQRVAGLGSLGRERYVALADWGAWRARPRRCSPPRASGRVMPKAQRRSSMRKSSRARHAFSIPLSICVVVGLCGALPRTARALSSRPFPRSARKSARCSPWVLKPLTFTWGASRPSRRSVATSRGASRDGFTRRLGRWRRR
jgi:hypothetical protein